MYWTNTLHRMNICDERNDCFHQINCPSDHGELYSVILQKILLLHTSVPKLVVAPCCLCIMLCFIPTYCVHKFIPRTFPWAICGLNSIRWDTLHKHTHTHIRLWFCGIFACHIPCVLQRGGHLSAFLPQHLAGWRTVQAYPGASSIPHARSAASSAVWHWSFVIDLACITIILLHRPGASITQKVDFILLMKITSRYIPHRDYNAM